MPEIDEVISGVLAKGHSIAFKLAPNGDGTFSFTYTLIFEDGCGYGRGSATVATSFSECLLLIAPSILDAVEQAEKFEKSSDRHKKFTGTDVFAS